MSEVQVSGHLFRKQTVRSLSGDIIDLRDEADGGWIIRKGQVVNQEKLTRMAQAQKDKEEAAKAQSLQKVDVNAPDRSVAPSKVDSLEKKVSGLEDKLDAILAALKK